MTNDQYDNSHPCDQSAILHYHSAVPSILLQSFPSDTTSGVAMGIGAILLLYLYFRTRKKKKDPLDRPFTLSLAQQRSVEREMSNLLVELSEMARQISAQLDTRAQKLELLIKEADEKIAMLKAAAEATPTSENSAVEILPKPSPYEPDPRHAEVYRLADEGRSALEIATQLDRPTGEIELILALRPH
jgi:hypothetical protein